MSIKTEVLFNNTWNVRISDPGEEGAQSHFFETIYLTLTAYFEGENVRYEFIQILRGLFGSGFTREPRRKNG